MTLFLGNVRNPPATAKTRRHPTCTLAMQWLLIAHRCVQSTKTLLAYIVCSYVQSVKHCCSYYIFLAAQAIRFCHCGLLELVCGLTACVPNSACYIGLYFCLPLMLWTVLWSCFYWLQFCWGFSVSLVF